MVLRRLLAAPGFAAIAILTLAIGIGANTAIFSIVDGALLRPLAYPQPGQLVSLHENIPQFAQRYPVIPVDTGSFSAWLHARSFSSLALLAPGTADLTGAGEPRQVQLMAFSASMFDVLGIKPRLGRAFASEEDQPKRNHVVILSDAFWRTQFHSDPRAIGQTIDLNGTPNQIVGVMPASFTFPHGDALGPILAEMAPAPADLFQPLGLDLTKDPFDSFNYAVYGRLRPGVSLEQGRAELQVLTTAALHAAKVPQAAGMTLNVLITPLRDQIVGTHRLGIWLLLAAVGAILLIVCLNLANLLLVRVHGRAHEIAIRVSLGASRAQLIREVLNEGLVLGLAGGALGVLAAWWAVRALVAAAPAGIPRLADIHLNIPVLLFALALALLSGLVFSLGPALRAAGGDPQQALRAGGRGASDTAQRMRIRQTLVGAQAALSALLLIVAGLLTASYVHLMGVDTGFQSDHILTVDTGWNGIKDANRANTFIAAALDKLRALPGVRSASVITTLPLNGTANAQIIGYEHDTRPMMQRPLAERRDISPDYFATMGIPLLRGRDLSNQDLAAAAASHTTMNAVVSASVAEKMWPGKNPLGQQFVVGDSFHCTVVGIVGDIRADGLSRTPAISVYTPFTIYPQSNASFALRVSSSNPAALAPSVRSAIWSAEPAATIPQIRTMDEVVSASTASRRFQLWLVLAFAIVAILLAALGIYGVVAYTVERRSAEIGLRITLGAQSRDLVRMVLRQGLTPVVVGVALGIAAALAVGHLLATLLFGVQASDPAVMAAVAFILLAVGAFACFLPALRALRTDPASVLRQ